MKLTKSNCGVQPLCSIISVGFIVWLVGALCLISCTPKQSSDKSAEYSPSPLSDSHSRSPSPPDLKGCTRIELRFLPTTADYFLQNIREYPLLGAGELKYLESLNVLVLDDREHIDGLAFDVSSGRYCGTPPSMLPRKDAIEVIGHKEGNRLAPFVARWDLVQTQEKHTFEYDHGLPSLFVRPLPGVGPLTMRMDCARNLWFLYYLIKVRFHVEKAYPPPAKWCDALVSVRPYNPPPSEDQIRKRFICPSASTGICHYAINPDCTPNSPPDTVLLFEAGAGWNQHGGPEEFVLSNHKPIGGCVLLNDGELEGLKEPTVLFVRTAEEAQQLRWK